jgi:hypothetical protein
MYSEFLKDAIRWRLTGGHAEELKRMGLQGATAAGNVSLTDTPFPALTSGTNNAGVGKGALALLTSGSNNWAVGKDAGNDAVATITTGSNNGVLGNNNTAVIYAKVALTVTSDERDKSQFVDLPWTMEMFSQIKTGMFQFRDRVTGQLQKNVRYGFSAQNLLTVEQGGAGRSILVDSNDPQHLKLNESMMVPVLVKIVQELAAEVKQLKAELGIQG